MRGAGRLRVAAKMPCRALVFDFDGLIIASEANAVSSWQDLYARFGHELPLEKWATLIGTWDAEWDPGAELAERVGNGHDWETIELERRAAELAGAQQLQALPGVIDRLDDAARLGLPFAIASSSDRAWVLGTWSASASRAASRRSSPATT